MNITNVTIHLSIFKYIIMLQKLKHCDMACEQTDRSLAQKKKKQK